MKIADLRNDSEIWEQRSKKVWKIPTIQRLAEQKRKKTGNNPWKFLNNFHIAWLRNSKTLNICSYQLVRCAVTCLSAFTKVWFAFSFRHSTDCHSMQSARSACKKFKDQFQTLHVTKVWLSNINYRLLRFVVITTRPRRTNSWSHPKPHAPRNCARFNVSVNWACFLQLEKTASSWKNHNFYTRWSNYDETASWDEGIRTAKTLSTSWRNKLINI